MNIKIVYEYMDWIRYCSVTFTWVSIKGEGFLTIYIPISRPVLWVPRGSFPGGKAAVV